MTDLSAYRRVVDGMWADPDLSGDLLAVGLYWAHRLYLDDAEGLSTRATARAAFGDKGVATVGVGGDRRTYDLAARHLDRVMRNDMRRYDPGHDPRNRHRYGRACEAPMIRRPGLCGQPASQGDRMWDLDTGEQYHLDRCPRHAGWAREQAAANRETWEAIPELLRPVPPANIGGVLRRHLPELDWAAYWQTLDPRWVEPPERVPFVRPAFTVLITDDVEPVDVPRPALTLVPQ